MEDEKKPCHEYLSKFGEEKSFEHCPEVVKAAMKGMSATNDISESTFAGISTQMQSFGGSISIHGAAGVSDMSRNGFLKRPTLKDSKGGLMFQLPEELQITCIMAAMEDAPETRTSNERQRKKKLEKEQLLKDKQMAGLTDEYIENLILHGMYNSDACWKTSQQVDDGLKRIKFKKDKIAALKDNILILRMVLDGLISTPPGRKALELSQLQS